MQYNLHSTIWILKKKNHATTHAITDIVIRCYEYLEKRRHCCLILLDIKKAFDSIEHVILQKIRSRWSKECCQRLNEKLLSVSFTNGRIGRSKILLHQIKAWRSARVYFRTSLFMISFYDNIIYIMIFLMLYKTLVLHF